MTQTIDSPAVATGRTRSPRRGPDHLDFLEAHAVFVLREVAAECERPVLLFDGGTEAAVLLRLAEKAFRPGRFPFPVLHADTGRDFGEVLEFRDERLAELGEELLVASVQDGIDAGRMAEPPEGESRQGLVGATLRHALGAHGFDACIGGARRTEHGGDGRPSLRDESVHWDPRRQHPELWHLSHGRPRRGEHLSAFPLSDWTELDVWRYAGREALALASICFAHRRRVVHRGGVLLAESPWVSPRDGELVEDACVRFPGVGDATCTPAVRSRARRMDEVIAELGAAGVRGRTAWHTANASSRPLAQHPGRDGRR